MPRISSEKYSPCRSGSNAPTVCVRRVIMLRAALEGTKRSCSTTPITSSRVRGVTFECPFSARDTVATETPARRATSLIVVATIAPQPPARRAAPREEMTSA